MRNVIEIENLSKIYRDKRFRPFTALDGVTFNVAEGEAFGFVGPNGAGKSTTIKTLTGTVRPTSGTARMFGVSVTDARSRMGLGYVPENPYLHDYLTPLEILQMGCKLHEVKVSNLYNHCLYWLERFDLAGVANKRIRQFSKGMTQRTALAHALSVMPKLLILDEPLSGLDPLGRKLVVDILAEYHREGGTLLFSSHVLHDVERLANRFGLIHRGQLRVVKSLGEMQHGHGVVSVVSLGSNPVTGMLEDVDGRWRCSVPHSELWHLLERVHQAGHTILEVRSQVDLEQVFLAEVSQVNG